MLVVLMSEYLFENHVVRGKVEDGIMVIQFLVDKFLLEHAQLVVHTRIAASNGKSYPLLVDARKVSSITKEARDYFATDEGSELVNASALLLGSAVNKFLGNFFLQISKPKIPLRLFTDYEEAKSWLKQFRT